MGLLQFKPNNQPGKGGSERLGHQGEDTQQVGGFDLQTWFPSFFQVTISVNTPDQPNPVPEVPHPQPTYCHHHFLGTRCKLSVGNRPTTTPHGSCPTEFISTDPGPDRGGRREHSGVSISSRGPGPGLPDSNSMYSAIPGTTIGRKCPPIPWSYFPVPGPRNELLEVQEVRANLGVLPQPLPENSSQGFALSHKERRLRSLTATHFAAFWGLTDGLLFTSLFQTLT